MSDGAILAIDQGTSGTKAIVVSDADGVLSEVEVKITPAYLSDGGVEQDPSALLESVLQAGREAARQSGATVSHVALANQGETVLAWDPGDGRPLSPAIVWQDRRAAGICEALADHADALAARTGLVLDPYFSAPKMRWIRDNITTDGVVTTTDSWLVHALCGEFVTDASTASRSLLIDVDEIRWDDELVDLFGLAGEPLPLIVDCDASIGSTSRFGAEMTVGGLAVDQPAALLAQGCHRPGEAKCTFGTGAFLLANTGPRAMRSDAGLTTSVAWRTAADTSYCMDGQIYTAASAVRWLTELAIIDGPEQLDHYSDSQADGVLSVPALAGLAAPWWRSDATASFTGMTLSSGRGQLVVAMLQGIAAQLAEMLDLIAGDAGQRLTTLRVDGGLTRSRLLMQTVADVVQIPIELYPSPHATALGATALGRMVQRPGLSPADAIESWQPVMTYEPHWTEDNAHAFRKRWRAAASANLPHGDQQ